MSASETALDRVLDFLVVATHGVLYTHGVYPAELFEARRRLGTRVFIARHPLLAGYVGDTVRALRPHLAAGKVDTVTVAVLDARSRRALARYCVRTRAAASPAAGPDRGAAAAAAALAELDAQLQAHILALYAARTPPPPAGGGSGGGGGDEGEEEGERTFEIVVRAADGGGLAPGGAWMAAAPSERGGAGPRPVAAPLKDPDTLARLVSVQSWLEFPERRPADSP